MSKAEIQAILRPQARKSARGWYLLVWVYLAVMVGTLICEGMHVYAFRNNTIMLTVGVLMTTFTCGFLAYGINLFREMAAIDHADESLAAKLQRSMRFYRTRYEIWLWMIAFTVSFLTFAVSTLPDAQESVFRINHPGFFIGFTVGQFLLMYCLLKIGHYPLVRETKAILSDLESQTTTDTDQVRELKKSWRLWGLVFAAIGTLLLIWGILRGLAMLG